MVGATGFEPAIFRSQSGRDTRLRYAPTPSIILQRALAVLFRQRSVVFLDRLAETFRYLVGARERERLVARVGLAPQGKLEFFELVDGRGLQLLEPARVRVKAIVVERLEVAHHLVKFARIDARLLELPAQRLGVVRPLAELAAELADVIGSPATVAAPAARVAVVGTRLTRGSVAAVGTAATALAVLRLLSLLSALALLTLLALLPLLAF